MNLTGNFEYLELEARIKRELEVSQVSSSLDPILISAEAGLETILIAQHLHSLSAHQALPLMTFGCSPKTSNNNLNLIPFQKLEYSTLFLDHAELLSSEEMSNLRDKVKIYHLKLILSSQPEFKEQIQKKLMLTSNASSWLFPPLRERKLDILPLAHQMGHYFFNWNGKEFLGFDQDAKQSLEEYSWPGNTLELSLCIQKASLLHELKAPLTQQNLGLPARMLRLVPQQVDQPQVLQMVRSSTTLRSISPENNSQEEILEEGMSFTDLKKKWADAFEKDYLTRILLKNHGNVSAAARESKIDRSNFLRLLRRHGIKSDEYRKDLKQVA